MHKKLPNKWFSSNHFSAAVVVGFLLQRVDAVKEPENVQGIQGNEINDKLVKGEEQKKDQMSST